MASPGAEKKAVLVEETREVSDLDLAITPPSVEYGDSKEAGPDGQGKLGGAATQIDDPSYDFTSDEFKNIPDIVRDVVSFEDDPTIAVVTFRSVVLTALFCVVGSAVSQLS
ncbi:hypothetical protein SCUCBS95973_003249 [Sporothrix curviconia]|uniref:Uncharacterized protein n=1 Tax=Sporothrix curviconia TaxID=1260050 RepID=A0ABP0BDR7_9PEZI